MYFLISIHSSRIIFNTPTEISRSQQWSRVGPFLYLHLRFDYHYSFLKVRLYLGIYIII